MDEVARADGRSVTAEERDREMDREFVELLGRLYVAHGPGVQVEEDRDEN